VKETNLTLDDVKAEGAFDVEFSGKPTLFARLSMSKLGLDRFFGGAAAAAPSDAEGGGDAASGSEAGWSTKPLDFSGLRMLNADLKLKTQGFSLRGTEVGPSELAVQVLDGNLHFTSSEASLAGGGKFSSDMRVNAATPSVSLAFNMSGVQARPILSAFMHFKKLSGVATAHVVLTAAGDSQKALIDSLDGHGDVDFKNGELDGIDLVKIAKLVQAHSSDVAMDEGATKFVDVTGTFSISRGIVSNTDLKMKGAVVQATGQGIVDLPKKYIQYKATPVLMVSQDTPPALAVPVKITGPFSDIRAVPDFAATVKNVIKNPSGAKSMLKNIGDNLKQNAILQKILNSKLLSKIAPSSAPESPPREPSADTQPAPTDNQPATVIVDPAQQQQTQPQP
jgi:AsmA protein